MEYAIQNANREFLFRSQSLSVIYEQAKNMLKEDSFHSIFLVKVEDLGELTLDKIKDL